MFEFTIFARAETVVGSRFSKPNNRGVLRTVRMDLDIATRAATGSCQTPLELVVGFGRGFRDDET